MHPDELQPYTVLRELKHRAEDEHECFGLPPGDPRDPSAVPLEEHVSLGMVPSQHSHGKYLPGQTVHLTDEQAEALLESGHIAPPGAALHYEMRLESSL